MFRRNNGERVAIYKRADCLGSSCEFYIGNDCNARLELLHATGKSGGIDESPYERDCNYALYGNVCMGGEEQVVVGLSARSPNGRPSSKEMGELTNLYVDQHIILNTPPEDVIF